MVRKSYKLNDIVRAVLIFLLFFGQLSLPIFNSIRYLGNINLLVKCISSFVTVFIVIFKVKKMRVSKLTLALFVYCCSLMLSTFINKASVSSCLSNVLSIMTIGLLCDLFFDNVRQIVSVLLFLGELLVYLNLLYIIISPGGLYNDGYYWQNWILGYKNKFSVYILVVLLVACVYKFLGGSAIRVACLFGASILSSILADSATQFLGYAILLLYLFIVSKFECDFSPYLFAVIIVIACLSLIVLGTETKVVALVTNFLGRNSSYSLRMIVWARAISLIKKAPLIGYGVLKNENVAYQLGFVWAVHCHNFFINIVYQGGFIALGIYIYFSRLYLHQLDKKKNELIVKKITGIIFIFFLMSLMESMGGTGFTWIIFYFAFYIDKILLEKTEMR